MAAKKPMADSKKSTFPLSTGEKKASPPSEIYVDKIPEGKTYDDIKAERDQQISDLEVHHSEMT